MTNVQIRNITEAILPTMTEEEFAQICSEQGRNVIYHRGRYWQEAFPGFYEPIHWMAKLSAEQATRPTQFCWGFRASLSENDAVFANGSIPVYKFCDFPDYDLHCLSANRRSHLKKCHKIVKIIALTDSTLLQEQGYEVFLSAAKRVGVVKLPSKKSYLATVAQYKIPHYQLILAGLIGDKLAGYIVGYSVDGTAYLERLYVDTEVLTTNLSLGLTFEFVQICRRNSKIHEVVNGLHRPNDSHLSLFKERIGCTVQYIPSHVWMNPIIQKFIRWKSPDKYYRLTGDLTS